MFRSKKPKRLAGDSPLLRAAYARHWDLHPTFLVGRSLSPGVLAEYADWLRSQGIDPDTGKMTTDGLRLYQRLLDEQNARNRLNRGTRHQGRHDATRTPRDDAAHRAP